MVMAGRRPLSRGVRARRQYATHSERMRRLHMTWVLPVWWGKHSGAASGGWWRSAATAVSAASRRRWRRVRAVGGRALARWRERARQTAARKLLGKSGTARHCHDVMCVHTRKILYFITAVTSNWTAARDIYAMFV